MQPNSQPDQSNEKNNLPDQSSAALGQSANEVIQPTEDTRSNYPDNQSGAAEDPANATAPSLAYDDNQNSTDEVQYDTPSGGASATPTPSFVTSNNRTDQTDTTFENFEPDTSQTSSQQDFNAQSASQDTPNQLSSSSFSLGSTTDTDSATASLPPQANPNFNQFGAPLEANETDATTLAFGNAESGNTRATKKTIIMSLLGVAVLLMASAGYVFGFYLPNTPENVWSTAMVRTGEQADIMIDKLADPESLAKLAKNEIMLTAENRSDGEQVAIDATMRYDELNSDNVIVVKQSKDGKPSAEDVTLKVKTQGVEDALYPNMYLNLAGMQVLGFDTFAPGIGEFDGKWIAIEQDFYDMMSESFGADEETEEAVKEIDQVMVADLASDINDVLKKRLFTDDVEMSALTVQEFVGTEESEGIEANHYKVAVNESNATALCNEIIEAVYANEKFIATFDMTKEETEEAKKSAKENCDSTDEDESHPYYVDSFDVWIDKKHKIFHKVRVNEDIARSAQEAQKEYDECIEDYRDYFEEADYDFCESKKNRIEEGARYFEYGQVYKGEESITLFAGKTADTDKEDSKMRFDITFDWASQSGNGAVKYQDTKDDSTAELEVRANSKPLEGKVDSDKPDGAVSILEVIEYINQQSEQASAEQQNAFGPQRLGVSDRDQKSLLEQLYDAAIGLERE